MNVVFAEERSGLHGGLAVSVYKVSSMYFALIKHMCSNRNEHRNKSKLEVKYSLESTDTRESEIRAPPQPLPYTMPIPPNTLFTTKNLSQPFCR